MKLNPHNKPLAAWGAGPGFELCMAHLPDHGFSFAVDSNTSFQGLEIHGVRFFSPDHLFRQSPRPFVIITAFSNTAIQSISDHLSRQGLLYGEDFCELASWRANSFQSRVRSALGIDLLYEEFRFVRTWNHISRVGMETTMLGNWLVRGLLRTSHELGGSIAEIGAFQCGNVLLQQSAMALTNDTRPYHVFDSFEGFPPLSAHDPADQQAAYPPGVYAFPETLTRLRMFPALHVHKGFVPGTFSELPPDEKFGLVFYDCDLYQPALDTFAFFWDRLLPGGFLVIHDKVSPANLWHGVEKAVTEFFGPRGIAVHDFWESTMAVVKRSAAD